MQKKKIDYYNYFLVGRKYARHSDVKKVDAEDKSQSNGIVVTQTLDEGKSSDLDSNKKKDIEKIGISFGTLTSETNKNKKKEDKNMGVKRKKLAKEEERLLKKQEKEERLLKKQEKLEKKKLILQSK